MAIYKDKKRGTWYYSVYVDVSNGKQKRFMKRGFKTKKEARDAEIDFLYNFDVVDEENMKFDDISEEYLQWYKVRRKKSSYTKIESLMRIRILPFFKEKYVKEITNRDVTRFHNELLAKFSVSSAKRTHAALSAVLNYAIRQDYLSANVAREVGNIDVKENKRMEFWTLEEFKKFISVVDDLMYRTFFMTLYFSGMRKGEQLALRWADIDFENNIINVDKTTYFNDITSPKTQSSVRKLKMPQHTMTLLGELKLRFPNKPDYFVFGEVYNHLSETTIDVHYNDYVDEAGVKRIRLHDFRHSHASYLINKGNDIQIVSKRLGHQNTSTTYDVYAHLYPNAEDEAIKNMEDDFKSADVIEISNFR